MSPLATLLDSPRPRIELIDLSAANPRVDVARLDPRIRGAYLKFDSMFLAHYDDLSGVGRPDLRLGMYVLYQPSRNPAKLARAATSALVCAPLVRRGPLQVNEGSDQLPLALDVEETSADADWIRTFLAEVRGQDVNCVVYMNTSCRRHFEPLVGPQPWWQAEYHRLVYPTTEGNALAAKATKAAESAAAYLRAGDQENYRKALAAKWSAGLALSRLGLNPVDSGRPPPGCVMHQYGGDANASTCAGVEGFCDRSAFLGSGSGDVEEDWLQFRLRGGCVEPARIPVQVIETTRDVQQALVTLGFPLQVDGFAGPKTTAAVRAFQGSEFGREQKLQVDGVAGPKTKAALVLALSEPKYWRAP